MSTTIGLITTSPHDAAIEWEEQKDAGNTCLRISATDIIQIAVPASATLANNILTVDSAEIGDGTNSIILVLSTPDTIVTSKK